MRDPTIEAAKRKKKLMAEAWKAAQVHKKELDKRSPPKAALAHQEVCGWRVTGVRCVERPPCVCVPGKGWYCNKACRV